jgi:DNA helicase-2/ATP-dependent DNA helicase PcrA
MRSSGFASLNEAQREAVVHTEHDGAPAPLLIIAGAGSGKTNTLAHRVAHLVHEGADPYRLLLLTFSRRAATELERRAGRALAAMFDAKGNEHRVSIPWAGTFHSVAARLLREYAERVGLVASFTIHDRADSEDLMAVVRQDLKIDVTKKALPGKRNVSCDLLACRQRPDRLSRCAARSLSVVRELGIGIECLVRRLRGCEASAARPGFR